jgi:hypothetical protein
VLFIVLAAVSALAAVIVLGMFCVNWWEFIVLSVLFGVIVLGIFV